MNVIKYLLLLVLTVFIFGCGASVPTTPLEYSAADDEEDVRVSKRQDKSCLVLVRNISDKRYNKKRFSQYSEYKKFAESVPDWVKGGLKSLKQSGYNIQDFNNDIAKYSSVILDVDIYKAYVNHVHTAKSANLALKITFSDQSQQLKSKVFRSNDSSINWSSSEDEMRTTMNEVLSKVLLKLEAELNQICA